MSTSPLTSDATKIDEQPIVHAASRRFDWIMPSTASTLKIIHHPNYLIDVDIDGTAYCGRVIATQPDKKGVGVFIVVGTNGNPNSYNEIEHITWKLSGKARVKKSGVWVDATQIGQCKGGWGRTSTEPPSGNFGLCNFFVALD